MTRSEIMKNMMAAQRRLERLEGRLAATIARRTQSARDKAAGAIAEAAGSVGRWRIMLDAYREPKPLMTVSDAPPEYRTQEEIEQEGRRYRAADPDDATDRIQCDRDASPTGQ